MGRCRAFAFAWLLASGFLPGGCGAGSENRNALDAGRSGPSDAAAGLANAEGAPTTGTIATVEAGSATSCSADLQSIVDDSDAVIAKCSPDQGCAGGACVPACDAARANHGSVGCDFVVTTPAFEAFTAPPCFAVFLTNSWSQPAMIAVARDGVSYDATKFARVPSAGTPPSAWPALDPSGLLPNAVAVLFLSSDPSSSNEGTSLDCPVPAAIRSSTAIWTATGVGVDGKPKSTSATGRGRAWHITTSVPVNGYDVLPYGGALSYLPSAQLLLPTSAWGTNYVAAMPRLGTANEAWAQVVASEDGTEVSVVPSVDLPGAPGVDAAPKNAITRFTLSAGDFIQWQWFDIGTDMSGSVFSSNHPMLFIGGHGRLCQTSATSSGGGCDSEHELVPPVSALGSEYAVSPYTTRRADLSPESELYRIVATVDGTRLTFDPPVASAPTALNGGELGDFETTAAFVVTSQDNAHPFFIAQEMPGCNVSSGSRPGIDPGAPWAASNCLGDEDDVGVIPSSQWLSRYAFFTDPSYSTTNIVLTRVKTAAGFKDVTLDCVGTVGGWRTVDSNGRYQFTNVDLVRAGANVGACDNGPHLAHSEQSFGLTVWGLDSYASYGYPAGGNFRTINPVIVSRMPR